MRWMEIPFANRIEFMKDLYIYILYKRDDKNKILVNYERSYCNFIMILNEMMHMGTFKDLVFSPIYTSNLQCKIMQSLPWLHACMPLC